MSEIRESNGGLAGTATLEAHSVSKHFGGVQALHEVSFQASSGEVHALLGANGAGKSTLVRILSGAIQPDHGHVAVLGEPVELSSPAAAMAAGVTTVHQELSLLPDLSVAHNIAAAAMPRRALRLIDRRRLVREVRSSMARVGLDVDPRRRVVDLSLAQQQLVEIARALHSGGRVLILDEPNSALSGPETERMLATIRVLAEQGIAVILVSHRLEEVFSVADRITVLRDGRVRGSWRRSATSIRETVQEMVGGLDQRPASSAPTAPSGEPALELEEVTAPRVGPLSLQLRRGEIVGLVGLEGSGTDATLRVAAGAIRMRRGTISIDGKASRLRGPGDAIDRGVVYLPPDRKTEGLWLENSLERNVAASTLKKVAPVGIVRRGAVREQAATWIDRLGIKVPSTRITAGALSGGNQQRVLFARCLATEPKVLLASEPTRGVDVAAKAGIHDLLRALARDGLAVCVASSEFDEILDIADRLICMREGKIIAEGPAAAFTKEQLLEIVGSKG
jgi:ABC-type sugar transport system ATPase subunit